MPRRATPLDPDDGPQARFAIALRRLRDEAGFNAKTIDVIAAETHMPRSTLYAALRGARIPTVPVLAALVRAWGGDPAEWLIRRTETEVEIERLRLHAPLPAAQKEPGPEERQRTEQRSTTRKGAELAYNILQKNAELLLSDIRESRPEDPMVKTWSDETLLAILCSKPASFWGALRGLAGRPTIRSIAFRSGVSQLGVSKVLKGVGEDDHVRAVYEYLSAQVDNSRRLQVRDGLVGLGAYL